MFVFRLRFIHQQNHWYYLEPLVLMDDWNCPVPSQVTWEYNLSPLNEMHIHQ